MKQAIGVDLGGTKINAGVVDTNGNILKSLRTPTPIQQGGDAILDTIYHVISQLMAEYGNMPVGIASPGLIDYPEGLVLGCTPNLPDWLGQHLGSIFEQRLQTTVVVDNDARAATWAEYRLGKGQGANNFVMLTLGTGLGSGIVIHGELLRNRQGLGIGYGHMIVNANGRHCNCGQQGCLEAYVSGTGLMTGYQAHGGEMGITGAEIFERAEAGESMAIRAIDEMLHMLAVGIGNILNTLAPDRIVLGGGMASQGEEKLLRPLYQKIKAIMSMPPQDMNMIQLATLGEDAGLIGAALLAFDWD